MTTTTYDEFVAGFYDSMIAHMLGNDETLKGDVEFYREEACASAGPVLEVGCGTGRVLFPIAEAGVESVGLDNAPAMLAIAEQKKARLSPAIRQRVSFLQGDVRQFDLGRQFSLIINPYHVFMHLLSPAEHCQALACLREHLTDDGRLILNVMLPTQSLIDQYRAPLGSSQTTAEVARVQHPSSGHLMVFRHGVQYCPPDQLVHQLFHLDLLDRAGRLVQTTKRVLTNYYFRPDELPAHFTTQGFAVKAVYGGYMRNPAQRYGEQVWVVSKN